jgi:hypothetical protein
METWRRATASSSKCVAGGCIVAPILLWRILPSGRGRFFLAGFTITGVSSHLRFAVPFTPWTTSSCAGRGGNTNASRDVRCVSGTGCAGFRLANRTCSRTGSLMRRLDDRSRMNREVHVRFWEGVGVRFPCATRLPVRIRDGVRGPHRHRSLLRVLQQRASARGARLPNARELLRRASPRGCVSG